MRAIFAVTPMVCAIKVVHGDIILHYIRLATGHGKAALPVTFGHVHDKDEVGAVSTPRSHAASHGAWTTALCTSHARRIGKSAMFFPHDRHRIQDGVVRGLLRRCIDVDLI